MLDDDRCDLRGLEMPAQAAKLSGGHTRSREILDLVYGFGKFPESTKLLQFDLNNSALAEVNRDR